MHSFSYFSKKVTSLFFDGFIQVYTNFFVIFINTPITFSFLPLPELFFPSVSPASVMSFIFWLSEYNYSSQHGRGAGGIGRDYLPITPPLQEISNDFQKSLCPATNSPKYTNKAFTMQKSLNSKRKRRAGTPNQKKTSHWIDGYIHRSLTFWAFIELHLYLASLRKTAGSWRTANWMGVWA